MEIVFQIVHLAFASFVALIPPVNPIGTALIVQPILGPLDPATRKLASRKVATYCFLICVTTAIIGSWIFRMFGISLPVVQVAGGILICHMGWQLLSAKKSDTDAEKAPQPDTRSRNIEDILFYPLAFPMTAGAGTIAVLLTLSAHAHDGDYEAYFVNLSALVIAIVMMSFAIFVSYASTPTLVKKLGTRGETILSQLSAFLVFCVGIQIISEGVLKLMRS